MSKASHFKVETLNNLNEFYAEITSQMNIIMIHYEKIEMELNKDKVIDFKSLLNNVKNCVQQHYLKMNECLKNIVTFLLRINA